MDLTTTTVTVPTHSLGEFYTYVGSLHADTSAIPEGGNNPPGWTFDEVKEVYQGGNDNQPWRDMLLELSKHPDEEVYWPNLCKAIDCTRQEAAGVLGAATRRCHGRVPFDKRKSGDETWFKMSKELAHLVQQVSSITPAATN